MTCTQEHLNRSPCASLVQEFQSLQFLGSPTGIFQSDVSSTFTDRKEQVTTFDSYLPEDAM